MTVSGQVGGNTLHSFTVSGKLYVMAGISTPGTTNGDNDRDCALVCGDPVLSPASGVIRWSSNQKLYESINLASLGSLQKVDDCFMSVDNTLGTVQMQLTSTEALQIALNGFNASGGLAASVYKPKAGTISLSFSADGNSVTGTIDVTATDLFGKTITYSATINGTLSS